MPLTVAHTAGFCMGVKRAVEGAVEAASQYGNVVSFGELAHNPQVTEFLQSKGIRVIHSPEEAAGKTVLIRSHGVDPLSAAALAEKALRVIDLTCPFVTRLHRVVSQYSAQGLPVIIVGDETHPEVRGTVGYARGSVYILSTVSQARELPLMPKAMIVAQTTLPIGCWLEVLQAVQPKVEELSIENTICTATARRQQEAAAIAAVSTAMLVVGGHNSANTRKLYETCAQLCERTVLVERPADIPQGFANICTDSIGITAGASTPDWSLKEVVTRMTDMEQATQKVPTAEENNFMADVEATLVKIKPGQTIKGTVLTINDEEVGINIGYKSDGLMKREDLVSENVKPGDEIEVEVVKVNDGEGNVLLSQRNILNRKAFAELVEKKDQGEYVEGIGKEAVKGGLICMVNGIRAFVPASQLSNRYVTKIEDYVGQKMKLKILEMDEGKKRIVASRRAVISEENAARREAAWAKIQEGAIIKGIVRRLTDFGAFVDLGGVDGLIHITDLCWHHIKHPSEIVAPDQEIEIKVKSVDREKNRVALSLKALTPHPWEVAPTKYPVGSIVTGKVVRTPSFGAFVELEPGLDGLVHISQCANRRIDKVEDAVKEGDIITAKVLAIDPEAKRISLSIRAMSEPEPAPEAPAEEAAEAPAEAPAEPTYDSFGEEEAVPVDVAAVGAAMEAQAQAEEQQ